MVVCRDNLQGKRVADAAGPYSNAVSSMGCCHTVAQKTISLFPDLNIIAL